MFQESFQEAWLRRFGQPFSGDAPPIELFLRHRSVREFDRSREVPETTVRALIGAAQSAATSSNLQLYSIISVQDPERRERIAQLCADQDQVRNCHWFFAFLVDHYRLKVAAEAAGQNPSGLDYFEYLIMGIVDAALAAERMVCAAESLGLGICYIGALRNHPDEVAHLLKLPENTFGLFGLCLGWPASDCKAEIKPRLPQESVWFREEYPESVDIGDYDDRMVAFYKSQGMNPGVNWSMRSGRRVDDYHLSGREVLKDFLTARGFAKR
ncbi:MAG: NADPH-dependent oxidoreductase [Fimbriimonadales bacterium]|nr:MAG: NADPH-dependent oxidoreductase [Fimbriimonadales bacterium]